MTTEDRTQFIGGSDVAAILGLDPYKTRLQVYEEKVGIAEPFTGNQHTRRGNRLEEVAAEEYMEKYGVKLQRVNRRIINPRYPFITARIDRKVVGEQKLTEFKCPSLGSYSKMKREGLHEGYIAQMHSYLGTTGYQDGVWGIFCADLWELNDFPVERDDRLVVDIEEQLAAFWNDHILKQVPPPADDADFERLEIRKAEGTSKVFTVTDPALMEAMANLRDAKKIAKEAEAIEEDAKARIHELTKDELGIYRMPGIKLNHYASKGRSSFDKKSLVGTRPLDGIKVAASIVNYLSQIGYSSDDAVARTVEIVSGTTLDLTQFEKPGNPYTVMRLSEEGEK